MYGLNSLRFASFILSTKSTNEQFWKTQHIAADFILILSVRLLTLIVILYQVVMVG